MQKGVVYAFYARQIYAVFFHRFFLLALKQLLVCAVCCVQTSYFNDSLFSAPISPLLRDAGFEPGYGFDGRRSGQAFDQYTASSKVLTLAILFDLVVCAANVLVPHIPSYLLVDHAVVVIPLLPIETSLVSMAALKLLHRSHYYRFVFRFGVVSGIALMLISVLAAVWQYYADLLNLLGSPESTGWRFTSVLFYVSLLHFAATILINFFVLVSTMLRYQRQINSYLPIANISTPTSYSLEPVSTAFTCSPCSAAYCCFTVCPSCRCLPLV